MAHRHFLCYSSADAADFSVRLRDALELGQPSIAVWFDARDLQPGQDWDEQLAAAIRDAEALLFVMTLDSVTPNSVCKREWTRALKYKKPVIPLLVHRDAEIPFRLDPREWIDFTESFDTALIRLRQSVQWRRSPEGVLQTLRDRLADARRDLARETDASRKAHAQDEINQLQLDIADQERIVRDPEQAAARVATSIAAGIERERTPQPAGPVAERARFINPPPGIAPAYFQDRTVETGLIAEFLKDDARRLAVVIGRGGVGKTAMVCRLLKALESGHLPNDFGAYTVDGIIYLSTRGTRRLNATNLFTDLLLLAPANKAPILEASLKNPQATTDAKIRELASAFHALRVIVLLDNFEDLVDPDTLDITDRELDMTLRGLLGAPPHGVKVIVTSRVIPRALALVAPGLTTRIDLDEGLETPYAEQLLRDMDVDGKVGLRSAKQSLLTQARAHTRGYPRALEALFAILSADRNTTLEELLRGDADGPSGRGSVKLPENVVEALVGEAYERLDPAAQKVMQALAAYGHPVTATAVDYLLQPYQLGVNSEPVLGRLRNMHFVRKERGRYYLHPVDSRYTFKRVPDGTESDREADPPPFSQIALLHRAADYFVQVRTPRETWKILEDVGPQLAEFDLRCAVGEYRTASEVLLSIDSNLELWGYYADQIALWTRVVNMIGEPAVEAETQARLGSFHYRMAEYEMALAHYTSSLQTAQQAGDPRLVSSALSGLGHCYGDLGWTSQAIESYEKALATIEAATPAGTESESASDLGNIGFFTAELGETRRAIEYHQRALNAYEQAGDRGGRAISLGNLGAQLAEIGNTLSALETCGQALAESRELRYRYAEAVNLTYLGDIFLDLQDAPKAMEHYRAAREIAGSIGNAQFAIAALHGLALAHLTLGHLVEARAAIDEAGAYNVPRTNGHVMALAGAIMLAQGEPASRSFAGALAATDAILERTPKHCRAWDCKGFALSGLTMCDSGYSRDGAVTAYTAARALNHEPGVVARALGLFDLLARMDPGGQLAGVRQVVAGADTTPGQQSRSR